MIRCNFCGAPDPPENRCASCGQNHPRAGRNFHSHPSRKLTLSVIEKEPDR